MDKKIRVLIVEDSAADAELLARELGKGDLAHISKLVQSKDEFLKALGEFNPDIILCDYKMPGFSAPEALEIVKKSFPEIPFIVVSGTVGEDIAVEMMKFGAVDYVMKDKLARLVPAVRRALEEVRAVSKRHELETKLAQAKETQFRALIENLPGKVFFKDRNSVYISCNENYAKDLKIKPEEIVGKTDYDFFPTQLAEKYRAVDKRVIKSGETENVEEEYSIIGDFLKGGEKTIINTVKVPVLEKTGKVTGLFGLFWDITERRKTENALKESEFKIRAVFDQAFQFIGLMTVEGILIEANMAALNFAGIKASDVINKPFWETPWWTHSPELQEKLREAVKTVARGGFVRFEATHIAKDSSLHTVDFSLKPVKDDNGKVIFMIPEGRDITDRKRLEEELRKTEKTKISTEIRSEFTSMVSHELRTPLAVIQGIVSLITDGLAGSINEEQKGLLDTAQKNVERLGRLINNVLDFQKIESGKMEYDIREYDMNKVVQEASESLRILSEKKGLDFRVKTEDALPKIKFDKDKIIQVLTNLVSNAIKFTSKGNITVSVQRENNVIHVEVRDTGQGIKAEDIYKLFHAFEQIGPTRNRVKGGTGLGLTISREIILAHGGKIWAESEIDKGSVFHFVLPVLERRGSR